MGKNRAINKNEIRDCFDDKPVRRNDDVIKTKNIVFQARKMGYFISNHPMALLLFFALAFMIFSVPHASATVYYINATGLTSGDATTQTASAGINITAKVNITIYNFTVISNTAATISRCAILNTTYVETSTYDSGSMVANGTWTNPYCYFSGANLKANTVYYLLVDNGGANFQRGGQSFTLSGFSTPHYTINCGDYSGNCLNNYEFAVTSITFANTTIAGDTTPPNVAIQYPANTTYAYVGPTTLNSTASDNVALQNCWYSTNSGVTNTTFTCNTNVTGLTSSLGSNTWWVWANDTSNNKNVTNVTFSVTDQTPPVINIQFPQNISYSILWATLNSTESDNVALSTCWYSTNSGTTNTTFTCNTNVTGLTSSQGSNTWLVGANDTANNRNMAQVTFFVNTSSGFFSVTLVNPSNNSVLSSSPVSFFSQGTFWNTNLTAFNSTLYVWFSNGTLAFINYTAETDNASNFAVYSLINSSYLWNSQICSTNYTCLTSPYNFTFSFNTTAIIVQTNVSWFHIDFNNFSAVIFFILFLVVVLLVYTRHTVGAGVLTVLIGYILLLSQFNPLVSFVIIIGGVMLVFI